MSRPTGGIIAVRFGDTLTPTRRRLAADARRVSWKEAISMRLDVLAGETINPRPESSDAILFH